MSLSARDGSNNPVTLKTQVISGEHVFSSSLTDPATGLQAQVANHTANNQTLAGTAYSMLVGSIGKLKNVLGGTLNFDVWRSCGVDLISAEGVPAVGGMLRRQILATTSSSVGSGVGSATLAMTVTAGFVSGAAVNLEPGTTSYESARIRSVITNTSITVDFPTGGALFAHTGSFQLQTFQLNEAREAPGTTGVAAVNSEGIKSTYRYSVTAITPVATPTDFLLIQGSATMTGRIKSIRIDGKCTTTAGKIIVQLLRRSTAGTIGSAVLTPISPMKHDPSDSVPTLTVSYVQTANYGTPGTLVAQGGVRRLFLNLDASGASTPAVWEFADKQDKPIFVRGTSDYLWINLAGSTLPTATVLDLECEIEEDIS